MLNLDHITNENNKEHYKNRSFIPYHPYRILIIGGSGSGITNALLNLLSQQGDIGKIYLYLTESKHEFLIKQSEDAGIKHLNDSIHLLSVRIQWMTFIKILVSTLQAEKERS